MYDPEKINFFEMVKRIDVDKTGDFIKYDAEKCNGCTLCVRNCPAGAIQGERRQPHKITVAQCTKCGICYEVCKFEAVVRS